MDRAAATAISLCGPDDEVVEGVGLVEDQPAIRRGAVHGDLGGARRRGCLLRRLDGSLSSTNLISGSFQPVFWLTAVRTRPVYFRSSQSRTWTLGTSTSTRPVPTTPTRVLRNQASNCLAVTRSRTVAKVASQKSPPPPLSSSMDPHSRHAARVPIPESKFRASVHPDSALFRRHQTERRALARQRTRRQSIPRSQQILGHVLIRDSPPVNGSLATRP